MNSLPVLEFASQRAWETWLDDNDGQIDGVWLKFAKKGSGETTLTHPEALDVALRYGWIDGQGKAFDEKYWLVRFSPRRPRSLWSRRNRERAEQLITEGRMKPAGMAQVEAARADGRWAAAYESQSKAEVPKDFLQALSKNRKAAAFYESLNRADRYTIFYRLHHSKREATRAAHINRFVEQLANHEKPR